MSTASAIESILYIAPTFFVRHFLQIFSPLAVCGQSDLTVTAAASCDQMFGKQLPEIRSLACKMKTSLK